jgi:hypothetical protein
MAPIAATVIDLAIALTVTQEHSGSHDPPLADEATKTFEAHVLAALTLKGFPR